MARRNMNQMLGKIERRRRNMAKRRKARFRHGMKAIIMETGQQVELVKTHRSETSGKLLRGVWEWCIPGKAYGTCPEHLMRPVRERGDRKKRR